MTQKTEWERTCNRFVAFLDIAGFKSLCNLHNEDHNYIYRILKLTTELCDLEENGVIYERDSLYIIAISDSIIIITKDDSDESFSYFTLILGEVFNFTFCLSPMNAVASYGNMTVDRENMIIFGNAYNRAYKLSNEMDYYGVLCDESFEAYIAEKNNKFLDQDSFVKIQSYFKSSDDSGTRIKNYTNLVWFDSLRYNTIAQYAYEKCIIEDGSSSKTDIVKVYDTIPGSYEQRVDFFIHQHFHRCEHKYRDKVKRRLNNTIQSIEDMQTQHLLRYRFDRI